MPDRVTVLKKNFAIWIQLASLEEITTLLHVIGRELLTMRKPGNHQAGLHAWQAAEDLYKQERQEHLTAAPGTNLTDQPPHVESRWPPR
jgi:hypothetical protein